MIISLKRSKERQGPAFLRDVRLKADLDGTIFAYDYRARLAYVMTHDIRTTHMWMS